MPLQHMLVSNTRALGIVSMGPNGQAMLASVVSLQFLSSTYARVDEVVDLYMWIVI